MHNHIIHKPEWLRKKIRPTFHKEMSNLFREGNIHTVCEEAMCPNISECFSKKEATFLILGTNCTRACTFCAVNKDTPMMINKDEPENIAQTVKRLGLRHVVITSPTRDDLKDGGSRHYCETVSAIKELDDSIVVELLIPDMKEDDTSLKMVANSGAEIVGHNIETVKRLYKIRRGADYTRSLAVLKKLLSFNPSIATKSAIMLGFGEKDEEVEALMQDLLDAGCRYLSIGQYLSPSPKHEKVLEYVKPERFDLLRNIGMDMGFNYIKSSPYTRSSYMAHEYLERR